MATRRSLLADVETWISDSSVDGIVSILNVAQAMIDRSVRPRAQIASATLTVVGNKATLPEDFQAVHALIEGQRFFRFLSINSFHKQQTVDTAFVDNVFSGYPLETYYTIQGSDILFHPSVADEVTLVYNQRLPRLVMDSDTNWLLENAYDLYLYACLVAAAKFNQMPEMEASYADSFRAAVQEFKVNENLAMFAAGNMMDANPERTII